MVTDRMIISPPGKVSVRVSPTWEAFSAEFLARDEGDGGSLERGTQNVDCDLLFASCLAESPEGDACVIGALIAARLDGRRRRGRWGRALRRGQGRAPVFRALGSGGLGPGSSRRRRRDRRGDAALLDLAAGQRDRTLAARLSQVAHQLALDKVGEFAVADRAEMDAVGLA